MEQQREPGAVGWARRQCPRTTRPPQSNQGLLVSPCDLLQQTWALEQNASATSRIATYPACDQGRAGRGRKHWCARLLAAFLVGSRRNRVVSGAGALALHTAWARFLQPHTESGEPTGSPSVESAQQPPAPQFRAPSQPLQPVSVRLAGPGASARGRAIGREVEVFAGAIARADAVPSLGETYVRLREDLEARGILTRSPGGLVFTQNHTFRSPSAAAIVLLGRPASGWNEWKDDQGRTLRNLQTVQQEKPVDGDE